MLARLALYLFLAADGRGITVVPAGAPDEGCPSSRQVTDALALRLPGAVATPGPATGANLLRLAVTADASGVRVDVSDPSGALVLRRLLPPAPRTRSGECAVLADTVALIVERYWREVGYDVPASPPPPPPPAPPPPVVATPPPASPPSPRPPPPPSPPPVRRPTLSSGIEPSAPARLATWSLGAALAGRTGGEDLDPTVRLTAATERRPAGLGLGFSLTAGVSTRTTATTATRTLGFRRFPLRLGAYLPINTPIGRIEPGIGAGFDLIAIDAPSPPGATPPKSGTLCGPKVCASPGADLAIGWSVFWDPHLYVRAFARGGLTAPFGFVRNDNDASVWSTPRTYLEVALETGVWFP